MYKWIVPIVLVFMLAWGTAAWAAEQIELSCLKMPTCCQITCVRIDLDCCGCVSSRDPLLAEFIDLDGQVLGTATFAGNWCNGETTSQLDVPVNSGAVSSIRLIKQNAEVTVTWASLRVFCGDECGGKWYKVFKGDLRCWDLIPVPMPEVIQPPLVVLEPIKQVPVVTYLPESKPDFSYFPEPEPETATEPEVIVIIGRG